MPHCPSLYDIYWYASLSQTVALPRPQEEEESDKSIQAQTEQTYKKH